MNMAFNRGTSQTLTRSMATQSTPTPSLRRGRDRRRAPTSRITQSNYISIDQRTELSNSGYDNDHPGAVAFSLSQQWAADIDDSGSGDVRQQRPGIDFFYYGGLRILLPATLSVQGLPHASNASQSSSRPNIAASSGQHPVSNVDTLVGRDHLFDSPLGHNPGIDPSLGPTRTIAGLEAGTTDPSVAQARSEAEAWVDFSEWFSPDRPYPVYTSKHPRNLCITEFLKRWKAKRARQEIDHSTASLSYVPEIDPELDQEEVQKALENKIVVASELSPERCDFQGFDWEAFGTTEAAVRDMRSKTYLHHSNLLNHQASPQYVIAYGSRRMRRYLEKMGMGWAQDLPNHDSHFRFRQMDMRHKPVLGHFQLRHLISAASKDALFYPGNTEVWCLNPETGKRDSVFCFDPDRPEFMGIGMNRVATLTAMHDILMVGGFEGQYAMKSLLTGNDNVYTKGRISTEMQDGSTNHIHTHLARHSGFPQAVFCSNDSYLRTLDCNTNRLVTSIHTGWAINCSVTSPDGRLRLLVGDHLEPWIIDADSGQRLVTLPNHRDYGFACDWAPDGVHVATGNQDGIVQIFDCRNWVRPVQILAGELAGVQTLKFSPLGSGKRVLAMAEPADYISVVDAQGFQSQQRFHCLGEIGGLTFAPDGSKLFVANMDPNFGGILEFDRAGDGQLYGFACPDPSSSDDGWWIDRDIQQDDEMLHTTTKRKRRGLELGEILF